MSQMHQIQFLASVGPSVRPSLRWSLTRHSARKRRGLILQFSISHGGAFQSATSAFGVIRK